jgi:exodeoxyribonuclease-3
VRLATWNVNSLTARMPRVLGWIDEHQPDILCLQETKQADAAFPASTFADLGYESAHHGDGRWNGVALLSRVGLEDPARGFGTAEDENGCRIVAGTCAGIRVHSVYVPNGRTIDHEQYGLKLDWMARLASYLAETCDPAGDVAVCGDFNIAPDDRDVWDPAAFVDATHVSVPERQALAVLLDWGLEDVYRRHPHRRWGLFVVGLPGRRLSPGPRDAHRPRAAQPRAGGAIDLGLDRPQRPEGPEAVRPRPGCRRTALARLTGARLLLESGSG